nr:MAG TPA: hypothetical protein [Caudoviricetes sp.]
MNNITFHSYLMEFRSLLIFYHSSVLMSSANL